MKFQRSAFSKAPRAVTKRRVEAAKRSLQNERDKFPLLAEWIEQSQPTAEQRIERFDQSFLEWKKRMRNFQVCTWKRARKMLRELPLEKQKMILTYWDEFPNHNAAYFADIVRRMSKQ